MCCTSSAQPPFDVVQSTDPEGYGVNTASWMRWGEGSRAEDYGWGDNNAAYFMTPLPWVQYQVEPGPNADQATEDDQADDGSAMPWLIDAVDSMELLYSGVEPSTYGLDVEEAAAAAPAVWCGTAALGLSNLEQVRTCSKTMCCCLLVVSTRHDS